MQFRLSVYSFPTLFPFSKPRFDAAAFGRELAKIGSQMFSDAESAEVRDYVSRYVAKGANADRTHYELTAFDCFCTLEGIELARKMGKLSGANAQAIGSAYVEELMAYTSQTGVTIVPSLAHSNLAEWLEERLTRYAAIAVTYEASEARQRLIENVCDFICDGEPEMKLKLEILGLYQVSSGRIYNMVCKARFR